MVAYAYEGLFPAVRDDVWKLLRAHTSDATIGQIHPLILRQTLVSGGGDERVVERSIDVRGKPMVSRWKLTYHSPEMSRWEVVESQGPWGPGTFVENHYSEEPAGTRIRTTGDLKITVLPFFIPQRAAINRVLTTVENEDIAFLRRTSPAVAP